MTLALQPPQVGRPTMSRPEWPSEGWFYKQAGETFGPVSVGRLKELLAAGRLQPRQAVWQRSSDGLRFVHAATAAGATQGEASPPPLAEPVSAGALCPPPLA
jgi:hypothetical protein